MASASQKATPFAKTASCCPSESAVVPRSAAAAAQSSDSGAVVVSANAVQNWTEADNLRAKKIAMASMIPEPSTTVSTKGLVFFFFSSFFNVNIG